MIRDYRAPALAVLVVLAGCTHNDTTAPRTLPVSITSVEGVALQITAGSVVVPAPTFVVNDGNGNPISGVPVTITVTSGGGTLTGAPTQSSAGPTSVGTWTLGTLAGTNTLTVTASGLAPFTLTRVALPGPPSAMIVASGNNQSALAGAALAQPVTFRLTDRYGNGVPNITVTFRVTLGEGFFGSGPTTVQTRADGSATAPLWILGRLAIPQQISATAGNITATASAAVRTQYSAEVRFYGPAVDPIYAAAFTRAINRINAEVVGALPPVSLGSFDVAGTCGVTGVAPLSETIASLIVYVAVKPIDGPGKIIASSGPCIVRSTSQLTAIGIMTFDVADIQNMLNSGQLSDVVLHEMQHVLGFGTLWTAVAPPLSINSGTPQTAYTGAQGIQGCLQSGGGPGVCTPAIPLENMGGPGTRDSHWRKSIFGSELMTGFISPPGTPMPLSVMTIGSLADLGYETNPGAADPYRVPSAVASSLRALQNAQDTGELHEELIIPRFQVTGSGKVTPLR
ncbi:MAG TPA: leishmanolysin-related zinc metalloendopeptidase [Gemmatimonadaceae bacterium]|nr:leishmanolysin-related zinc metalloendopeptidase [Gemmatimonadaceae bacterium]